MALEAPKSAERMSQRLRAVLRFWAPLSSARYLYSTPHGAQSLEELMVAACGWALEAWCPVGEGSVRERLEQAAERMARATREECIEAIVRQLPLALAHENALTHRAVLSDPAFVRERLAALDAKAFERLSGAWTAELLGKLHDWDRQVGLQ